MVAALQILRSLVSGNRPASRQYGEPYVNLADNQFGIVDASNLARDLLGVPIFSTGKSYVVGNPVNYQGLLYIANTAVAAGAWNATQWTQISGGGISHPLSFNVRSFTASGTYTPSANLNFAIIECVGGGGGGGGAGAYAGNQTFAPGGGSGGYSRVTASAATIGASQTVTIGAAGGAGTAAGGNGGNGGTTSVGTLCVANGGLGGHGFPSTGGIAYGGGAGGAPGTGDIATAGAPGDGSGYSTAIITTGTGGSGTFGGGGKSPDGGTATANVAGIAGRNYGSGGSGGFSIGGGAAGGAGSLGYVVITEFIGGF